MSDTSLSISIPALIFPAISLLFISYTTRFLGLTSVARNMLREHLADPQPHWEVQLRSLRHRLQLIRRMQLLGLAAIILAALSMGALANGLAAAGQVAFVAALGCFIASLGYCVHEIRLSIDAIEVEFLRARVPGP
jgi:hypothetical protein